MNLATVVHLLPTVAKEDLLSPIGGDLLDLPAEVSLQLLEVDGGGSLEATVECVTQPTKPSLSEDCME